MFHGKDITSPDFHITKYRTKVGMVFQSFNLFPQYTVKRNVTLAPELFETDLLREKYGKRSAAFREEKKKLTVPDLLALFSKVSGQEYDNDRALLA